MKVKFFFVFILSLVSLSAYCQKGDEYQIYAVKYFEGRNIQARQMIAGANPGDSVRICFMVWLLKGENGRNILVDAGFIDTTRTGLKNYVRPDSVLRRINVSPADITDIIMTHPHYDHIGGINLFPKAIVWMQKNEFDYFVGGAWQEKGSSIGYEKNDVRNIIEINLQGRLKLIDGDDIEIFPGIKVFTGSKHTFENQYILVNSNSGTEKTIIASDAIWFYYNYQNLLPATLAVDPKAYTDAMKRMKTLVTNPDLVIPGHDDLVFSKFPEVAEWIVRIGK